MALSPNQNEGIFKSLPPALLGAFPDLSASSSGVKLVPDISTNHLWDFSDSPPWLMFQQCSFGIERSPCRLPSDSLRNSLRKHVLPNSLRHALISLTGKETRGSKKCKEQSLNCCLLTSLETRCWPRDARERWTPSLLKTHVDTFQSSSPKCCTVLTWFELNFNGSKAYKYEYVGIY